jgi:hypothetical protein
MFALVQRVHVVHVKEGKVVQMTGEVDQPVLNHAQQELQQHSCLHTSTQITSVANWPIFRPHNSKRAEKK